MDLALVQLDTVRAAIDAEEAGDSGKHDDDKQVPRNDQSGAVAPIIASIRAAAAVHVGVGSTIARDYHTATDENQLEVP